MAELRFIEDFPVKGVRFIDISPKLADKDDFSKIIDEMSSKVPTNTDYIIAPESRGYIFGTAVANKLNLGFVPIRKPHKLPREEVTESYDLEYGKNTLCIHADAIKPGQRVLIVDDLLATGGTMKAACNLIEKLGGVVAGIAFVIELEDLKGRDVLMGYQVHSIIKY